MVSKSLSLCVVAAAAACLVALPAQARAQDSIRAVMAYRAPGAGPAPNFSPKGSQVTLFDVPADMALPEGSTRPAKSGTIKNRSWRDRLDAGARDG